MAILQTRRRFVLAVVLSVSITTIVYTFRLSSTTLPLQTRGPRPLTLKKPSSRFYQINNVTIDFAHAGQDFEHNFIQHIQQASLETTLSYHLYSHFNPNNDSNSPNITLLENRLSTADILFVSKDVNEEALLNASSYLIFESSDFFNFTFEFVDRHRHWSHIIPPLLYVDNLTRINLFYFKPPLILLKRAPPVFEDQLTELWNLQHPENCSTVVKEFPFAKI